MKKSKTETTSLTEKAVSQIQALWGKQRVLPKLDAQVTLVYAVIVTVVLICLLIRRRRTDRRVTENGYVVRRSRSGRVRLEHRAVAEEILGRRLDKREIVHHINGRRRDNRPENLCVMDHRDHVHYHEWYKLMYRTYGNYPRRDTQLRKLREDFNGKLLIDLMSERSRSA